MSRPSPRMFPVGPGRRRARGRGVDRSKGSAVTLGNAGFRVRAAGLARAAGLSLAAWCASAAVAADAQPAPAHDGAPAPAIEALAVVSHARSRGTYALGETVELAAVFDGEVDVDTRDGIPAVVLVVGSRRYDAAYAEGSGSRELRFRWDVAEGAVDADGFEVAAGMISLNGGDVRGRLGARAALGHGAVPKTPGQRVDGERPEVAAGPGGLDASGGDRAAPVPGAAGSAVRAPGRRVPGRRRRGARGARGRLRGRGWTARPWS